MFEFCLSSLSSPPPLPPTPHLFNLFNFGERGPSVCSQRTLWNNPRPRGTLTSKLQLCVCVCVSLSPPPPLSVNLFNFGERGPSVCSQRTLWNNSRPKGRLTSKLQLFAHGSSGSNILLAISAGLAAEWSVCAQTFSLQHKTLGLRSVNVRLSRCDEYKEIFSWRQGSWYNCPSRTGEHILYTRTHTHTHSHGKSAEKWFDWMTSASHRVSNSCAIVKRLKSDVWHEKWVIPGGGGG